MKEGHWFQLAMGRAVQNGYKGDGWEMGACNRLTFAVRAVERGEHLPILRDPEFAARLYRPRLYAKVQPYLGAPLIVDDLAEVQREAEAYRAALVKADDPLDFIKRTDSLWNVGGMHLYTV
jgi:hypothetical protein